MVRGGGEAAAAAETKAPGIFSPNSGVPTYFTHSHSDFAANETETFCKKKLKNQKDRKFFLLLSNEVLRSAISSFKSVIQKLIDNK